MPLPVVFTVSLLPPDMFVSSAWPAVCINDIVRSGRGAKSQQGHSENQGYKYFIHGWTSL
jgi:hypothetical protein